VSQRPVFDAPARWLDAEQPTVAENLALDEALLAEAHDGLFTGAVVRTWMASTPTVVLGSSSRVTDEVDLDACRANGVDVLRRPSGGLTVVLGPGCLMWSVIVAWPGPVPTIDRVHAAILEPLCGSLNEAGRPVVRRGSSDLAVVTDGVERKVSGNALRVRRQAVLYHGTLLDAFDLSLIGRVLRHPPREPDYRQRRTHDDFLANLALGRATLEAAVRQAFLAQDIRRDWPADQTAELLNGRYLDADWTNRLP